MPRNVSPNELVYEEAISMFIITLGLGYVIYKLIDGRQLSTLPRLSDLHPHKQNRD